MPSNVWLKLSWSAFVARVASPNTESWNADWLGSGRKLYATRGLIRCRNRSNVPTPGQKPKMSASSAAPKLTVTGEVSGSSFVRGDSSMPPATLSDGVMRIEPISSCR